MWVSKQQAYSVAPPAQPESLNLSIVNFLKPLNKRYWPPFGLVSACRPLSHPNHVSELIQTLVEAVEANPEKRWKEKDFQALSVDASTARRQFKKRFGMTLFLWKSKKI